MQSSKVAMSSTTTSCDSGVVASIMPESSGLEQISDWEVAVCGSTSRKSAVEMHTATPVLNWECMKDILGCYEELMMRGECSQVLQLDHFPMALTLSLPGFYR